MSKKVSGIMDRESLYGELVDGVGPDAPIVTNEKGAKQSSSPYRTDLLPARAILEVSRVLAEGAKKYAPNNWRGISFDDHINHMLTHAFAFQAGDDSDDHLGHMACRALMALETYVNPEGKVRNVA